MDRDISRIIKSWEYEPNTLAVRKIIGDDGREKIQIRVNLGVLQMEVDGRPDGKTPHNSESLLEYYNSLIEEYRRHDGTTENFTLTEQDTKELDIEIIQYYHRRICLFALKDYILAKKDAEHNLQIMDIIKKYCKDGDYIEAHEQFRPFVIMERTRAAVLECINSRNYADAMNYITDAIDMIEGFYKEQGTSEDKITKSDELAMLRKWRSQIHQDWEGGVVE